MREKPRKPGYLHVSPQTMTLNAPVKYDDLLAAYEWVSSSPDDSEAFVSRVTGNVHWTSSTMDLDEELRSSSLPQVAGTRLRRAP